MSSECAQMSRRTFFDFAYAISSGMFISGTGFRKSARFGLGGE